MSRVWIGRTARSALGAVLALSLVTGAAGVARAGLPPEVESAKTAVRRGDNDAAIRFFTRALARRDVRGADRATIYLGRGAVFEILKRYDAMASDMQHAIALQPRMALAHYGLGLAYYLKDEPRRAIAAYDRALAFAPRDVTLLNARGRAHYAAGDLRRARADFGRAIALDPKYAFAYDNLGLVDYDQQRYDAAFRDFTQAVKLNPQDAEGYKWRGAISFWRDQPAAALTDLNRAISLDPTSMNAFRWRGLVNFTNRQFSDAAADFDAADRLRPAFAYSALWAYISRLKLKTADQAELRTVAARFDLHKWPGRVFSLFLGEQTYDDVLARATAGTRAPTTAVIRCEAAFYAAELALSRDDAAAARPLLDTASKTCPAHYVERDGAVAELRWLDAHRTPP